MSLESNKNPKQDVPKNCDPVWREWVIERARRSGYISLGNLVGLLAADEQYIPHLQNRYMIKHAENLGERFRFWELWISSHAPGGSVKPWYPDDRTSPQEFPPIFQFNENTKEYEALGKWEKVGAVEKGQAFVKCDDSLKGYFLGYGWSLLSEIFVDPLERKQLESESCEEIAKKALQPPYELHRAAEGAGAVKEQRESKEPIRTVSKSVDTISGKKVSEKYKRSLLRIREAIRDGILHPTTQRGERIYDINQPLCQFEEGSIRAGSKILCDLLEEPRWKRAVAELIAARRLGSRPCPTAIQNECEALPSEHPAGWYGIDLSTTPEEFNDQPAVFDGILKIIAELYFSEKEARAWVTRDRPNSESTGASILGSWVSGTDRHYPSFEEKLERAFHWYEGEVNALTDQEEDRKLRYGNSTRVRLALKNGYLSLGDLAHILAEEISEELLNRQWKEIRSIGGDLFAKLPLPLGISHNRSLIWGCILEKAGQGTVWDGSILPLYRKTAGSAGLVAFDFNSEIDSALLKLADVKEYFNRHYLPLPESLFPDENREELEETRKHQPSEPAGEVQDQPGAENIQNSQREANTDLSYPPEILSLMRKACQEIEDLWGGVQSIKKTLLQEGTLLDLYREAALIFIEKNAAGFKILKRKHLEESSAFYPFSDNPELRHLKRNIVGKLYQQLICEAFPRVLPEPGGKQGYSFKDLYEFHKEELKRISPTSPQLLPNPV